MKPVSFRGFQLNSGGVSAAFDRAYQRPAVSPVLVRRQGRAPKATAVEQEAWTLPALGILIDGDDAAGDEALRRGLLKAFDSRSGPGALIVADDDGANERYMYAVCQNMEQEAGKAGLGFTATLVAEDEPFWESVSETTVTQAISAPTGATVTVSNEGDVDAEPRITAGPWPGKTGSAHWKHRRFARVFWPSTAGAVDYPYELSDGVGLDTHALVVAGKINDASGYGVIVDGVEVDRWFSAGLTQPGGFDSATTETWINLDFQPGLATTLRTAIASSGAVTEIAAGGDISAWPAEGIIQIDFERFHYTGRDVYRGVFTGVSRAAYDSTTQAHSAGVAVHWLQHEVWIVYTPGLNVARTTDDSRKPLIDLAASSNAAWVWQVFGSAAQPARTAQWTPVVNGTAMTFTGHQNGAATDPYAVMGINTPEVGAKLAENLGRWQVYLPSGLSAYDIDGSSFGSSSLVEIEVSANGATWSVSDISEAGDPAAWVAWNETRSGLAGDLRYLAARPRLIGGGNDLVAQIEAVTVTFQTGQRPSGVIGSEFGNYQLQLTITNETTGEALSLMPLPGLQASVQSLMADSPARTVTIEPDGINAYSAMRRDAIRPALLRLIPGDNEIRLEDPNTSGIEIEIAFRPRWYV